MQSCQAPRATRESMSSEEKKHFLSTSCRSQREKQNPAEPPLHLQKLWGSWQGEGGGWLSDCPEKPARLLIAGAEPLPKPLRHF